MSTEKTLAFTGRTPQNIFGYASREPYNNAVIRLEQILEGFLAKGFTQYLSGGFQGADSMAFWAVNHLKQEHPEIEIHNNLILPYKNQDAAWSDTGLFSKAEYAVMLKHADSIVYADETLSEQAIKNQMQYMLSEATALLSIGTYSDMLNKSQLNQSLKIASDMQLPIYRFWQNQLYLKQPKQNERMVLSENIIPPKAILLLKEPEMIEPLCKNKNSNHPDFLIVDGSSLLCTRFFGSVPKELMTVRTTEEEKQAILDALPKGLIDGKEIPINAIDGFINALIHCIKEFTPTHVAICFDKDSDQTFRKKLYPNYKAQRGEKFKELVTQILATQSILKTMNIPILMNSEYEADDYAGSLTKKASLAGYKVALLTADKDYLQLVDNETTVWMLRSPAQIAALAARHGEPKYCPRFVYPFTPSVVRDALGIFPEQVAEWKALAGDSSDNLPGVQGIGEATAIKILRAYHDLDEIYEHLSELPITQKYKDVLENKKEDAYFFKSLTSLVLDLPLEKLSFYKENINWPEISKISTEGNLKYTYNLLLQYERQETEETFERD